jgi:hypothetical protein
MGSYRSVIGTEMKTDIAQKATHRRLQQQWFEQESSFW